MKHALLLIVLAGSLAGCTEGGGVDPVAIGQVATALGGAMTPRDQYQQAGYPAPRQPVYMGVDAYGQPIYR